MVDYYVDMLLSNLIFTDQTIAVITVIRRNFISKIISFYCRINPAVKDHL